MDPQQTKESARARIRALKHAKKAHEQRGLALRAVLHAEAREAFHQAGATQQELQTDMECSPGVLDAVLHQRKGATAMHATKIREWVASMGARQSLWELSAPISYHTDQGLIGTTSHVIVSTLVYAPFDASARPETLLMPCDKDGKPLAIVPVDEWPGDDQTAPLTDFRYEVTR